MLLAHKEFKGQLAQQELKAQPAPQAQVPQALQVHKACQVNKVLQVRTDQQEQQAQVLLEQLDYLVNKVLPEPKARQVLLAQVLPVLKAILAQLEPKAQQGLPAQVLPAHKVQ